LLWAFCLSEHDNFGIINDLNCHFFCFFLRTTVLRITKGRYRTTTIDDALLLPLFHFQRGALVRWSRSGLPTIVTTRIYHALAGVGPGDAGELALKLAAPDQPSAIFHFRGRRGQRRRSCDCAAPLPRRRPGSVWRWRPMLRSVLKSCASRRGAAGQDRVLIAKDLSAA